MRSSAARRCSRSNAAFTISVRPSKPSSSASPRSCSARSWEIRACQVSEVPVVTVTYTVCRTRSISSSRSQEPVHLPLAVGAWTVSRTVGSGAVAARSARHATTEMTGRHQLHTGWSERRGAAERPDASIRTVRRLGPSVFNGERPPLDAYWPRRAIAVREGESRSPSAVTTTLAPGYTANTSPSCRMMTALKSRRRA